MRFVLTNWIMWLGHSNLLMETCQEHAKDRRHREVRWGRNIFRSKQYRHRDVMLSLLYQYMSSDGDIFLPTFDKAMILRWRRWEEPGGCMIRVSDIGWKHINGPRYDILARDLMYRSAIHACRISCITDAKGWILAVGYGSLMVPRLHALEEDMSHGCQIRE